MKRIADGPRPPSLPSCDAPPPAGIADTLGRDLDDATLRYVDAMQLPFDQLRQAAGQIAGVLVLAVTGAHGAAGHPMLELAQTVQQAAADAVSGVRPPPRGRHHHRHLADAARAIGAALSAARRHLRGADDSATEAVIQPLRTGYRDLQWAAGALPGFEVVAFSQGCCARHPAPARTNEPSIRE